MVRWIVGGLIVVVFVGLIVFDETRTEAPLAPPPEVLTEASPEGSAEVAMVGGAGDIDHAEHEARDLAKADCDPVAAVIEAALGLEKREAIGDAMYLDKAMKPEEVAALCRSVAGQPDDVIVSRFLEVSGLTR